MGSNSRRPASKHMCLAIIQGQGNKSFIVVGVEKVISGIKYNFTFIFNVHWQESGVGKVKANIIFEPSDWDIHLYVRKRNLLGGIQFMI